MPLGEEHFAKISLRKHDRLSNYTPGSNLRVEAAARILRPGQRLLDVGCADGLLGTMVCSQFGEIYGVDISERAVELARQRGVKAYKVNLNVDKLPFDEGYFDSVACLGTLQLVYDPVFVLSELHRVLRTGGELVLTVANMRTYRRIFKLVILGDFPKTSDDIEAYDGGTLHYFCYRNLELLLRNSGFQVNFRKGIFCRPQILEKIPDWKWIGKIKAEFIGAEIFVRAVKVAA